MMDKAIEVFLETTDCGIWIKNLEGRYIYINSAYENIHNKKRDFIIGKTSRELFGEGIGDEYEKNCKAVSEADEIREFYEEINGRVKQCKIMNLRDSNNEIIGLAGIIHDVNERYEREQQLEDQKSILRTIIDSIPDVIFYKNKSGMYIGANKECSDFYKKIGVESVIGKTDLDINPNKKQAEAFMRNDVDIMNGKQCIHTTTIIRGAEGLEYREVTKTPVIDKNNEVWGLVGISRNVTEKKILEEKLKYLSYTDILTGLYNRSSFEEKIKELNCNEYLPLGIIMGDVNGLKLVNDTLGHLEGDKLLISISSILNEVCNNIGYTFRWGGDEFVIIIPNATRGICEDTVSEINDKCKKHNSNMVNLSISFGVALMESVDDDIYLYLREAEEKVYRQKLLQEKSISSAMMYSLRTSLEAKNMETEEHTERLVKYAQWIGKKLGLSLSELDELALVTRLHDIGKIGINEEILLKPGKLSDEEFRIMKTHTEKGFRIVKATNELHNVAMGVLTHHERWDGNGYPLRLKGNEIPLYARIVCVVDSYDVMINDRVYKKAMSKKDAKEELIRCAGSQFDPKVVKIFIGYLDTNEDSQ